MKHEVWNKDVERGLLLFLLISKENPSTSFFGRNNVVPRLT
jgi:hypothetical protein